MDQESIEYYRARLKAEREAAENAPSEEVRRVHEELARGYEVLAREADGGAEPPHRFQ